MKNENAKHIPVVLEGLFGIRHDRYCPGACKAEEHGLQIAQAAQAGDRDYPSGPWMVYYDHDGTDEDGNPHWYPQAVYEHPTESAAREWLRAAIARAEGR